MTDDEKTRLRTAFNTVTEGMDKGAMKLIEKQAAADMAGALVEYEALAVLAETHAFGLVMKGEQRAFITFKKTEPPHLLAGAVIRI